MTKSRFRSKVSLDKRSGVITAEGICELKMPETTPTGNKNYLDEKTKVGETEDGRPIYCRVHVYTPSPDTPMIRRR